MRPTAQQGLGGAVQAEAARFLQLPEPVGVHHHRWRVGRAQVRRTAVGVQRVAHPAQHGRRHFLRPVRHSVAGEHGFPGKYDQPPHNIRRVVAYVHRSTHSCALSRIFVQKSCSKIYEKYDYYWSVILRA